MEPVTHFLTGACLARAGFNRKTAYATLTMTLAAEMPDLDVVWGAGGPVLAFQHHRGITHTFLGLPFEAAIVVGVVWGIHRWRLRRRERIEHEAIAVRPGATAQSLPTDEPLIRPLTAAPARWGWLYVFALIALLSHLLLDWTNNYGLRPFYPFDTHWYAGSFVFIFEPVMFAALAIGLGAPSLFGLIAGEVGARKPAFRGRGWAIAALTCTVLLWGWRWFEHDAAVQMASNAAYGPGPARAVQTTDAEGDENAPPPRASSTIPAEILRVTADPYPANPFLWQTVVETPAYYQVATVDLLKGTVETDPSRDLFYKPQWTPAVRAARKSWLGRVYLDWSSWPIVADIGPTAPIDEDPRLPAWHAVSFRDLRFQYDSGWLMRSGSTPPLSATAYVDSTGNVVRMQMGDSAQK